MKIICSTETLSQACQNVQRAVSAKSSIPAIEGILLNADNGCLHLTGYDLEVGINTSIDAEVKESGSIILNARYLCDIIRRLPDEKVEIEADARQLCYIRSGETNYSLNGISAEEYPELPSVTGGDPVIIDQGILKNMIRQTIFAVADNNSNVVYTGIKFEIEENLIKLIAVDGVRLAIRTEEIDYQGEELSFIVPAKTLSEVVKLIDEEEADVSLTVAKRHIIFEVNGYSIVSRLLEGDFLDYRSAVPSSFGTTVKVSTKSLMSSIDRTSLLITDRLKSPVRCIFDESTIKISSITSLGTANDKLPAEIEGERVEIGFNNRFLIEALRVCDTDEVLLKLNSAVSPIVILPPQGESFLFLVLPVRLK